MTLKRLGKKYFFFRTEKLFPIERLKIGLGDEIFFEGKELFVIDFDFNKMGKNYIKDNNVKYASDSPKQFSTKSILQAMVFT